MDRRTAIKTVGVAALAAALPLPASEPFPLKDYKWEYYGETEFSGMTLIQGHLFYTSDALDEYTYRSIGASAPVPQYNEARLKEYLLKTALNSDAYIRRYGVEPPCAFYGSWHTLTKSQQAEYDRWVAHTREHYPELLQDPWDSSARSA